MEESILNRISKQSEHPNLVIQEGILTLTRQLLKEFKKKNPYSESRFIDYMNQLHFSEVQRIVNHNYFLNKGLVVIGEEYLYRIFLQIKKIFSQM